MTRFHRSAYRAAWLLAAGGWLLPLSGCANLRARSAPELPPLEVPAPPPRAVESPETDVPPPVPLPEEPTRHPAGQRRPTPPPKPEPPKLEPPKSDQTPPQSGEPPKPPDDAAKPPPATTLQTIPAGAEVEVERTVRAQISRASSDLSRVDYRVLNTEGRTQYESAKSFVRQAEDALRAKNLVFARSLAEKAAALAAQLAGK